MIAPLTVSVAPLRVTCLFRRLAPTAVAMSPRSVGIKNHPRAILAVVVFGVCANHPAGIKNNTRAVLAFVLFAWGL